MKKIISVLLAFVMFISIAPISSYARYNKEIMFRDIPFGTKYEDAIKAFEEQKVFFRKEPKEDKNGCYVVTSYTTVAGHPMEVTVKFASMDSYKDSIENCVLYSAEYYWDYAKQGPWHFYGNPNDEVLWPSSYIELRDNLIALYGKYDETEENDERNFNKYTGAYHFDTYFYGKGTLIDLYWKYNLYQNDYCSSIYYRWTDGEDKREELYLESLKSNNGGTGGL